MTYTFTIPYFAAVANLLAEIERTQAEPLETAARLTAQTLEKGGIIHTFGCGHSASAALEPFHRSGSFAAVDAILDPGLMFQCGAAAGTAFERLEGYAAAVLDRHEFAPDDVLFIVSNSGRNPAGVDAALYAKKRGVKTIAVTAAHAHRQSNSRHSGGLLLKDAADVTIDNCCSANETALETAGVQTGPVSTVAGACVLHAVMTRAAEILAQKGLEIPVYKSSNAGGDAYNAALEEKYKGRVKHLK